jgi:hypothetical protein
MMRRLSVSNTVLLIICIRLCTNAARYSHVGKWHFSDVLWQPSDVRLWGLNRPTKPLRPETGQ